MTEGFYTSDAVRKMVKTDISRKLRDGSLDVPTLPQVANQVLALVNRPDVTAKDLEAVISHDQKLAARLIKVANSPVYGGVAKITSIQRAVVTIGLRSLQEMVFSIAMGEKIFHSKTFAKYMEHLWHHSLAVGFIAREIARLKSLDSEYAFLCGMLHDVGKPILLNSMESLSRKKRDRFYFTNELVDEILHDFHEQVGGLVATSWRFPDLLKGAIRHHHDYGDAGAVQQMALLTHVANLFAHAFGFGSYADDYPVNLNNERPLYELNLFPDEVQNLRETLPAKVQQAIDDFK
ncbi:MAG: HDOD domain-containing protein [Candidatus Lernaella stagnicola]|nr:HDOD domain-containing protein [Candidatus Lernaella stagnicola]